MLITPSPNQPETERGVESASQTATPHLLVN